MKTANVSLRHVTLAMLLSGVVGAAWAVGPTATVSPTAALSAAAGIAPAAAPAANASDAPAVAPVQALSSTDDDRAETTLKKASALQAKYVLRKIQSDIDKLDNGPGTGQNNGGAPTNFPTSNPLDALRAATPTPMSPVPLSQKVDTRPVSSAAPVSPMKVIGTYGLGDSAYADMIVDDSRLVATRGLTLTNGYQVESISANGVDVAKGRKHLMLPVVTGPMPTVASTSTNSNSLPVPTGFQGSAENVNRFNQITGAGPSNIPPSTPSLIVPAPVGAGAGGFNH